MGRNCEKKTVLLSFQAYMSWIYVNMSKWNTPQQLHTQSMYTQTQTQTLMSTHIKPISENYRLYIRGNT